HRRRRDGLDDPAGRGPRRARPPDQGRRAARAGRPAAAARARRLADRRRHRPRAGARAGHVSSELPSSTPVEPPSAHPLSGAELSAFVAAVETGSVHGAADALDLTQSAVTKRLQSLERRTGLRLLERGRFGTRPTEAGRVLHPQARRALESLAATERALA